MGLVARKTCFRGGGGGGVYANNEGADQHAHSSSLISALVMRLLERIISVPAASEILIF